MSAGGTLAFRGIDEAALAALAADLANAVRRGGVLYLDGELGAGKTTFARALLEALGVDARIKSPTYSLIESYPAGDLAVHHLDLYRIADPGELEWLGLADLTIGPHLIVVEWPERAGSALPPPDMVLQLAHAGAVRDAVFSALTPRGEEWLQRLPPAISSTGNASV